MRDHIGYLKQFAAALDKAEREGGGEDSPEGARTIRISDTLARQTAAELRETAECMGDMLDDLRMLASYLKRNEDNRHRLGAIGASDYAFMQAIANAYVTNPVETEESSDG